MGGGKTLLLPLLDSLANASDVIFILDERLKLPKGFHFEGKVYRVKATVISRLWLEWSLRSLLSPEMLLLSMGNLPPFFAHNGEQHVFIQNRYLIDLLPLDGFSWEERLRIIVERWWLKSRAKYVTSFIVQTDTMRGLLRRSLKKNAVVLPFAGVVETPQIERPFQREYRYDYIYVASGEPHKNHKKLIEAWIDLAEMEAFPSLCLTLKAERFPELCAWIESAIKKYSLKIFVVGEHSHKETMNLYSVSKALIYPSLLESFGLPLIESTMLGLPVLASNSDYVWDVVVPSDTFDPVNAQSIANAVFNFSFRRSTLRVNLLTSRVFLRQSINQRESI